MPKIKRKQDINIEKMYQVNDTTFALDIVDDSFGKGLTFILRKLYEFTGNNITIKKVILKNASFEGIEPIYVYLSEYIEDQAKDKFKIRIDIQEQLWFISMLRNLGNEKKVQQLCNLFEDLKRQGVQFDYDFSTICKKPANSRTNLASNSVYHSARSSMDNFFL